VHRIHVHQPPISQNLTTFRAHLESTQHEHMADSYDGALDGLLAYIGRLGWSKKRSDYQVIDVEPSTSKPIGLDDHKAPIYVHRVNGQEDEWVAEPSGAPHLSGYGPTAEEAIANCESTLKLHGFDHMFGEAVYT